MQSYAKRFENLPFYVFQNGIFKVCNSLIINKIQK